MRQYKYPRTPHLPWSPGATFDDIKANSMPSFIGRRVIVTEKMDGENTNLYRDSLHARSLDSRHHPSRNWVKAMHGRMQHKIPEEWRICGENLYAKHSIFYPSLPSYFLAFSIWDQSNTCLSWDNTLLWAQDLGLAMVPLLYDGIYDEASLRKLTVDTENQEGYVLRLASAFPYAQFSSSIAKWVRPHHVQSEAHWMHSSIVPNQLRSHKSPK